MKTVDCLPEGDLLAIANHDFSSLSQPFLVACRDQEQLEEFTWREGLICTEVLRFRNSNQARVFGQKLPQNKVLLLLPCWEDDAVTRQSVEWWVNQEDRYTVQLRTPRPLLDRRRSARYFQAACLIAWAVIVWLAVR